jgi:hypothetical protein
MQLSCVTINKTSARTIACQLARHHGLAKSKREHTKNGEVFEMMRTINQTVACSACAVIVGVVLMACAPAGLCQTLPPPAVDVETGPGAGGEYIGSSALPSVVTATITGAQSGCAGAIGAGSSSVCGLTTNPEGPAVAAETAATSGDSSIQSYAWLQYEAQINGPAVSDLPVLVGGALNTSAIEDSYDGAMAQAELAIYDESQSSFLLEAYACSGCISQESSVCVAAEVLLCVGPDIMFNDTITPDAGDILIITMEATAGDGLRASAFVDPFLEIDPSFPDADEFSITLSSGIGNPIPLSSVPESSSFAILATMLAGFWFLRRKSTRLA